MNGVNLSVILLLEAYKNLSFMTKNYKSAFATNFIVSQEGAVISQYNKVAICTSQQIHLNVSHILGVERYLDCLLMCTGSEEEDACNPMNTSYTLQRYVDIQKWLMTCLSLFKTHARTYNVQNVCAYIYICMCIYKYII